MTRSQRARIRRLVAGATGLAITITLGQALPAEARSVRRKAPEVQQTPSVPGREAVPETTASVATVERPAPAVRWPEGGRATVDLSRGRRRAGTLPVWVAAKRGGPRSVEVEVLSRRATSALGVTGLALRVRRADGSDAVGDVTLTVDYTSFRYAVGGDWASRLRLVRVGRSTVPVGSVNHSDRNVVEGTVTTRETASTFAVAAAASGASGSYNATPLAPSSAWQVGLQTGDFTWSYPFRVPPGLNGPTPQVALSYSSGSVDGRTASQNAQPSWIGEGHSMEWGFVERKYVSCADDMVGGNNSTQKTADLCWRSDNATLSLGGHSGTLIKDPAKGWLLENDDGSKIEKLTVGGYNNDNDTEYWKLTTTDGTQYFFGVGKRYATDTIATSATWSVPVFGNHTGEPCRQTTFDASHCMQAWRWNLAYVVDPHGNTMTYFYTPENNNYGRINGALNKVSTYQRGGYLSRIEYGERKGTEHTTTAVAQVTFGVAERCLTTSTFTCDPTLIAANPTRWPDVPADQICSSTTDCRNQPSPTFFTRKRLTSVTTKYWNGTAYADTDSWALTHSFPDPGDGTTAALWLESLTHTGKAGTAITLPSVTFGKVAMENRVQGIAAPALWKFRVANVTSETGAITVVGYTPQECSSTNLPATPATNTKRCFPVYWAADGQAEPTLHWFHKYLVSSVTEDERTGASLDKATTYQYLDLPAWHYDDNELTPPKYRTWGDWRGYGIVRALVGTDSTRSMTEHRFARGMDGDKLPSGTRDVWVQDSLGGPPLEDHPRLRGFVREEITFDGPTGAEISGSINDPWISSRGANGTAVSNLLGVGKVRTRTRLASGGYRTAEVAKTFDDLGQVVSVDDLGDPLDDTDDTCTRTTYLRNISLWITNAVSRVETVKVRCSATPSRPGDVVSDGRMYYDNATVHGTTPTRGLLTKTEAMSGWTTGPVYTQRSKVVYDAFGRMTEAYDALNRKTTTAYTHTPATTGPVTQVATTNAKLHKNTTTLHPAWGVTTAEVDQNGKRTDFTYDALGRLTAVWAPGRLKSANPTSPTARFTYLVRNDGPVVITSEELMHNGTYAATNTLFDGLLRQRQTQAPAPGTNGGRVLTDLVYDSRGLVVDRNGPYYNSAAPGTSLLLVDDNQMPSQVRTTYDGAGRPVVEAFRVNGNERWRTTTSYGGDRVAVTPPAGGTATTGIQDHRGRLVALRQHHGPTPASTYDETTYAYLPDGKIDTVTDAAGNQWEYGYDALGRTTSTTDPDRGTTQVTYDNAGQVLTTTDSRNQVLAYEYDEIGRKTLMRTGSATGPIAATWTYDTITGAVGKAVSSSRFVGGEEYKVAATGYDDAYRPTGSTITIPPREGTLAGTYTTSLTYHLDGNVKSLSLPALPGLAAETLNLTYTTLGLPYQMGAFGSSYVGATLYSPFSEVLQLSMGQTTKSVWNTFFYEEGTRRAERMQVDRETVGVSDMDMRYSFDAAGNLVKASDVAPSQTADTQCYRYDHLRRLTEAWTPTDDCVGAPGAAALGGPAPYWHSYTYDAIGNRRTETQHAAGGDTVRTYGYPLAGQPQPHTLRTIDTTVGGAATGSDTFDYDSVGNLKTRTGSAGQTLTWDAEGHLASVQDSVQGLTEFLYDAEGERLIRRDKDAVTLFLDNAEVRLDRTSGARTSTRYYTHGGRTIAVRTAAGLETVANDLHGTAMLSVHNSTTAVSRRRMLPFGAQRGAGSIPGQRGFVGGTVDGTTGLTHLGAREYDPGTGRFVSVDPLIDHMDPQQMHGYAYSNNNPTTFSDPDGLMVDKADSGGGSTPTPKPPLSVAQWERENVKPTTPKQQLEINVNVAQVRVDEQKRKVMDTVKEIVDIVSDVLGIKAAVNCFTTGDLGACGETLVNVALSFVGGFAAKILKKYGAPWKWGEGLRLAGKLWKLADRAIGLVKGWFKASDELNGARKALSRCADNSFVPGTLVLLADGSTKPIEDVDIGDEVVATDPQTGETAAKPVIRLITGDGVKHLVDVEIDGEVVTATDGHPFWVDDAGRWVPAAALRAGDDVLTARGERRTVGTATLRTEVRRVHNLTVDGIHTYYVLAGDDPVLVHNCMPANLDELGEAYIKDRHMVGGTQIDNTKGVFNKDVDLQELAEKSDNFPGQEQLNGGCARVCVADDVIGTDVETGLPTKVYTVITDRFGGVDTMHPGVPR
ncbi:MAG TPA: polymorphic toxin-type HINT domain-containing protein [Frankiaceae bacterium]|nr:polymorphic toxin-type HINT domain-containing protein [Frankiaceae bacterium]